MVQAASISTSASGPAYRGPVPASDPAVGAAPGSGADGMFGRLFRAQAASASTQGTAADEVEAAKARAGGGVESGREVAGADDGKLSGAARAGSVTDAVTQNTFAAAQQDAEARKIGAVVRGRTPNADGENARGESTRGAGVRGGEGKDKTPGKDKKDGVDSEPSGAAPTLVAAVPASGFAAQAAAPMSVSGGGLTPPLHTAGVGSSVAQTAGVSTLLSPAALLNVASASGLGANARSGLPSGTELGIASGSVPGAKVTAQPNGEPTSVWGAAPSAVPGAGSGKDALTGRTPAAKAQGAAAGTSVAAAAPSGTAKTMLDAAQSGIHATGLAAKTADSTAQIHTRTGTQSNTLLGAQVGAVMASAASGGSGSVAHSAAVSSAGVASAVSANPYDRMDQSASPVMLHSGAQQVAVGVRDSSLGWVEIRAQNVSGHVDATLVAASGQTQASLASQLPAMAQFVAQQDVRLGALVVQQQASSSVGGGFSGGTSHGSGAGQGGANPNGANSGGGFNQGGFMGGFGNPSGGSRSPSSHSSFSSGRSVGGVPASGVSESRALYESGEDADFGPVSYINVRA